MSKDKPSILVVSHGAAATGFSRVAAGIIRHLTAEYDFYQFATNHRSHLVDAAWPVYGNPNPLDAYGLDRLTELCTLLQPQIVLVINDPWFCCMHIQRLLQLNPRPVTIAYCPIDGILTRPEVYAGLALYDQLVAYNVFGAAELKKITNKAIPCINHGTDLDVFKPFEGGNINSRAAAKKMLFDDPLLHDSFIVLNASKHQLRKRIDLTIKGFALFAKDKPNNVKLFLHTGASFDGPDLRPLIESEGIARRLVHSEGWLEDHPAVSESKLNLIYNATDVGVNSSTGEGWGLVSFEHAATGAPQIVPGHSACTDLWKGVDTVLPVLKQQEHQGLGILFGEIGVPDIAAMLEQLYSNKDFRKEQAEKAYANARRPELHWENIAGGWTRVFRDLL